MYAHPESIDPAFLQPQANSGCLESLINTMVSLDDHALLPLLPVFRLFLFVSADRPRSIGEASCHPTKFPPVVSVS